MERYPVERERGLFFVGSATVDPPPHDLLTSVGSTEGVRRQRGKEATWVGPWVGGSGRARSIVINIIALSYVMTVGERWVPRRSHFSMSRCAEKDWATGPLVAGSVGRAVEAHVETGDEGGGVPLP